MKNISVRVPWHENGWDNQDKNCPHCENEEDCIRESGRFMCDKEQEITISHPYIRSQLFKGLEKETSLTVTPYTLIARPFRWTLTENKRAENMAKWYQTLYDKQLEDKVISGLGFKTNWVTHGHNQKSIFEYFYKHLKPHESLVFPYSKRCSLTDSYGRILIGIGHISNIGEMRQYAGNNDIKPLVWERNIEHTIRQDGKDGFLFPFKEIKQFLSKHPDRNPDDFLVIIPQEYQLDFSYATDYVSIDATIWTLNRAKEVLQNCQYNNIGNNLQSQIDWLDTEIEKTWQNRPVYPGLGALLSIWFKYGFDLAEIIEDIAREKNYDAIDASLEIMQNRKDYITESNSSILNAITNLSLDTWKRFAEIEGLELIKKICQFELGAEQMNYLINLIHSDASAKEDFIENPYALYERTMEAAEEEMIRLQQIDYAVFPKDKRPVVFQMESDDKRRLRALLLRLLQEEENRGNTICPQELFMNFIQKFRPDLDFTIPNQYTLDALQDYFNDYIITKDYKTLINDSSTKTEEKNSFYKTRKMQKFDDAIHNCINERLNRHNENSIDWQNSFGPGEFDFKAEQPKIADALGKLAENSFSILTGGAGTAKTSVVVKLCREPRIHMGKVLFLAPTGKATQVFAKKFEQSSLVKAQTVAQFLLGCNRRNEKSKQCSLQGGTVSEYDTIIIDECSMITETEIGALLDAVRSAKRVIMVGDPNQLPPIGPGRPFFDIINYIKATMPECLIELTFNWRRKGNRSFDVEFAKIFTKNPPKTNDEFELDNNDNENIELVSYESLDEIPTKVFETVATIAGMQNIDDQRRFDESIGGKVYSTQTGNWMNFKMEAVGNINNWQVISPYKNNESFGTMYLNHLFHEKYRTNTRQDDYGYAKTIYPYGEDKIILGDKIINTINTKKIAYNCDTKGSSEIYLPNGAVGLIYQPHYDKYYKKYYLNAVFDTYPNASIGYEVNANSTKPAEKDRPLELAYALTTHKVQGSTYKNTIVVLYDDPNINELNAFVSRELIYTALTRHSDKLYLIYNRKLEDLLAYLDKSDIENRLTDLFVPDAEENKNATVIVKYKGSFYNSNLKHITIDGDKVRSKSELIIANQLHYSGLAYTYENCIILRDGKKKVPDFTITTPSGKTVYWEHLGMLNDDSYKKAWEEKKAEYEANGISKQNGNLFTTEDDEGGGLDSKAIEKVINQIKKL